MTLSANEFGKSFQQFMHSMASAAPAEEPPIRARVRRHFGAAPDEFAIVSDTFDDHDHVNLHMAVESLSTEDGWTAEAVGVCSPYGRYAGLQMATLIAVDPGRNPGSAASVGAVEYKDRAIGDDLVVACLNGALVFLARDQQRVVILVDSGSEHTPRKVVTAQILAPTRDEAAGMLSLIRTRIRQRNVYRGRVLSIGSDGFCGWTLRFHHLPEIVREQIILPDGVLERVERQTIGFAQKVERLRATGRHVKRGVLLHGPPGTGKTLTAMYLAARAKDRTVLLLTGRSLGLIEQTCAIARALEPSTVVLEDVDLVAQNRSQRGNRTRPILFELLNQMDGLNDDADVLFLLTTNRPEILEPALAARPGRIDQAIEIPLPDEDGRRRLFELYGRGLRLELVRLDDLIRRTAGASGAFIRELLRRAALFASDEDASADFCIRDAHAEAAMRELIVDGGELTRSFLGFAPTWLAPSESAVAFESQGEPVPASSNGDDFPARGLRTLAEVEQQYVQSVLRQFHGNRERTATALGISARTLYRKLREYGE